MFSRLLLVVLTTAAVTLPAAVIDNSWQIFIPEKAAPTEKQSAAEITAYIEKICKLKLKTIHTDSGSEKVITIKGDPALDTEEYRIEINGSKVAITGGLPQGVLFGAYCFIEDVLGCRFLSINYTHIPQKKSIVLPGKFTHKVKPFFFGRKISPGSYYGWSPNRPFQAHRQYNAFYIAPEYGWFPRFVEQRQCHTYYLYTEDFPKDKPEYFSMDKDGNRQYPLGPNGPGNLCFTYMPGRDLVVKKMVEVIERDREFQRKNYPGMPYPVFIDVSANDNGDACYCPNCMEAVKKYQNSYSDLVLEFTNDIARRIDKLYPGMIVQFFAYNFSQAPPKVVKAEKNVMVQLAVLGSEFYRPGHFRRDVYHDLDHPNNRETVEALKGWGKSGAMIRFWDYWKLYCPEVLFPATMVGALPRNIRVYAENNCRMYMAENQFGYTRLALPNFSELAHYLGSKLLIDPTLDEKAVIADFMTHYYGKGGKYMQQILDMIVAGQEKEPGRPGLVGFNAAYITKDFLLKADRIFELAEQAVANEPVFLQHIGRERVPFDDTMLFLERRLKLEIDRNKVITRLYKNEKNALLAMNQQSSHPAIVKWLDDKFSCELAGLPIPEQFAGKKVWDFPWYKIRNRAWTSNWVNDPAAAAGKAMRFDGIFVIQKKLPAKYHSKELVIGLTDTVTDKDLLCRKIDRKKMFTDEKYHWYHVGKSKVKELCTLYVHESKQMPLRIPQAMYDPKNPDAEYNIYISIKLEGSSYAPGSKKADAIYVDRVIFTD